jgi:hypothetical protein
VRDEREELVLQPVELEQALVLARQHAARVLGLGQREPLGEQQDLALTLDLLARGDVLRDDHAGEDLARGVPDRDHLQRVDALVVRQLEVAGAAVERAEVRGREDARELLREALEEGAPLEGLLRHPERREADAVGDRVAQVAVEEDDRPVREVPRERLVLVGRARYHVPRIRPPRAKIDL